jgi:hypothetical protein
MLITGKQVIAPRALTFVRNASGSGRFPARICDYSPSGGGFGIQTNNIA